MTDVTPFPKPSKRGPKPRKPLRSVSKKRADAADERRAVREQVFERDGHMCVLKPLVADGSVPPCRGKRETFHHLEKASAGGDYTVENGVTLCAGHQVFVEDHPAEATGLGLVIR
jgi:hypothetical protein